MEVKTMKSKTIMNTAVIASLAMGLTAASSTAIAASKMEKCYGVVKKGMNDCGTKVHACAGQATENGSEKEWLLVPEGTCKKLVNGRTK